MSYQVYRVTENGLPLYHQAIFVETHENGPQSGHLYHVKGTIQNGMLFEHRPAEEPDQWPMFAGKTHRGVVLEADYPTRFISVCESVPPPKKQFEGARRLYPKEPLRRCGEWAHEAVRALIDAGVLKAVEG